MSNKYINFWDAFERWTGFSGIVRPMANDTTAEQVAAILNNLFENKRINVFERIANSFVEFNYTKFDIVMVEKTKDDEPNYMIRSGDTVFSMYLDNSRSEKKQLFLKKSDIARMEFEGLLFPVSAQYEDFCIYCEYESIAKENEKLKKQSEFDEKIKILKEKTPVLNRIIELIFEGMPREDIWDTIERELIVTNKQRFSNVQKELLLRKEYNFKSDEAAAKAYQRDKGKVV